MYSLRCQGGKAAHGRGTNHALPHHADASHPGRRRHSGLWTLPKRIPGRFHERLDRAQAPAGLSTIAANAGTGRHRHPGEAHLAAAAGTGSGAVTGLSVADSRRCWQPEPRAGQPPSAPVPGSADAPGRARAILGAARRGMAAHAAASEPPLTRRKASQSATGSASREPDPRRCQPRPLICF